MTFHDQTPPEVDPFQAAAESLLYAGPEDAAKSLRDAILQGAAQVQAHQSRQSIIERELAASRAEAERFANENPDWAKDPMTVDAIKAGMRVEQLNDLMNAGVDIGKWSESLGRVPSPDDIYNAHLEMRAAGNRGVRTPAQLFDDVASQVETKFGLRRRLRSEEHNRARAVRDRLVASAKSHGMTPEEYAISQPMSRQANLDAGEEVTTQSIQQATLRAFGDGVTAEEDASRKANHRDAIARMQQSRVSTKMAPQAPQVQVDMDRNSRRHADRRAG
jgi:hypothetical protein